MEAGGTAAGVNLVVLVMGLFKVGYPMGEVVLLVAFVALWANTVARIITQPESNNVLYWYRLGLAGLYMVRVGVWMGFEMNRYVNKHSDLYQNESAGASAEGSGDEVRVHKTPEPPKEEWISQTCEDGCSRGMLPEHARRDATMETTLLRLSFVVPSLLAHLFSIFTIGAWQALPGVASTQGPAQLQIGWWVALQTVVHMVRAMDLLMLVATFTDRAYTDV